MAYYSKRNISAFLPNKNRTSRGGFHYWEVETTSRWQDLRCPIFLTDLLLEFSGYESDYFKPTSWGDDVMATSSRCRPPTCRLGCGKRSRSPDAPWEPRRPGRWCSPPDWTTTQSYRRHRCRHRHGLVRNACITVLFIKIDFLSGWNGILEQGVMR